MPTGDEQRRRAPTIGRRGFVVLAGLATAGLGVGVRRLTTGGRQPVTAGTPSAPAPPRPRSSAGPAGSLTTAASPAPAGRTVRWSDPQTWGGRIPGPGDAVEITRPVVLDVDAEAGSVAILAAGALTFDPGRNVTLVSAGNVVVEGRLRMRPSGATRTHVLRFTGIDEHRFAGGGVEPIATDVGLWVVGDGSLDVAGAEKLGWSRAAGAIAAGDTEITLATDPRGWRVGDEIVITPTLPPSTEGHALALDVARILTIEGRRIGFSRPVDHAHPAVTVAKGRTFHAEVLNLTRTVRIEGAPDGRTHVFLRSRGPQTLRHIAVRYAGPRKAGEPVLGRYGLHFHFMGDAARASVVEGAVVRECGTHAFVPHASHGITLRDCIAYDTLETAYWWDPEPENATDDVLYDRCAAVLVRSEPDHRGFRHAGFWMGAGEGNRARGCVAAAVQGNVNASGFIWPEKSIGVWDFRDCISHNNHVDGLFVWQNSGFAHVIRDFVAYHCGKAGIEHGAYRNGYRYADSVLYGNGEAAIVLHATSRAGPGLRFENVLCDGAGIAPHLVRVEKHTLAGGIATVLDRCTFRGATEAAVALLPAKPGPPSEIAIVECAFTGNEFWLASDIDPASVIRVTGPGGAYTVRRKDQPGVPRPRWNASVLS